MMVLDERRGLTHKLDAGPAPSRPTATTCLTTRASAMALPPQPQKASSTTSRGPQRAAMAPATRSGVTWGACVLGCISTAVCRQNSTPVQECRAASRRVPGLGVEADAAVEAREVVEALRPVPRTSVNTRNRGIRAVSKLVVHDAGKGVRRVRVHAGALLLLLRLLLLLALLFRPLPASVDISARRASRTLVAARGDVTSRRAPRTTPSLGARRANKNTARDDEPKLSGRPAAPAASMASLSAMRPSSASSRSGSRAASTAASAAALAAAAQSPTISRRARR